MAALAVGGGIDGAAVASVATVCSDDTGSKNTPFTSGGNCCCSAETSPAWDIARSVERAPDDAEDGYKKVCKGFPPPTPGAKF